MIKQLIEILQADIETELENKANGLAYNYGYAKVLREVIRIAEGIKKEHDDTVNITLENVDFPDEQGWYLCYIDAPLGLYQQTDAEVRESFGAVYVIDGYVNMAGFENGTLLRDFIDARPPLKWIRVINNLFPKITNDPPTEHGYYFVYQDGSREKGIMVLYVPYTKTYQIFGSELVYPAESLIGFVWEQINVETDVNNE